MKVTYTRDGTTFAVDVEKLPPKSLEYLLQYGFAQSLQDSIAGRAKAVRAECVEKGGMTEAEIVAAVEADIAGQLGKRQDAIAAGTVGTPSPRDPVATLAREQVKAALAKAGKKVDADKLAELVAGHVEKNRTALVAELNRRKEELPEVDLDI